ncbi:MAG: DUF3343 domain-containing protein [Oscillospiraceae bacterium]|nr:DUF3343 domain-containing protein [Oscillospiraceae bacterium]
MEKYIFAFPSVTIAIKAKTILKSSGYRTDMIRTPKNLSSGCGYSVVAEGDLETISEILSEEEIIPRAVGKA